MKRKIKLGITGSSKWDQTKYDYIQDALDELAKKYEITEVYHTSQKGVDRMSMWWCFKEGISYHGIVPRPQEYGRPECYYVRNKEVIDMIDIAAVFPIPGDASSFEFAQEASTRLGQGNVIVFRHKNPYYEGYHES